jgi:hypothetical protein
LKNHEDGIRDPLATNTEILSRQSRARNEVDE